MCATKSFILNIAGYAENGILALVILAINIQSTINERLVKLLSDWEQFLILIGLLMGIPLGLICGYLGAFIRISHTFEKKGYFETKRYRYTRVKKDA